MVYKEFTTFPRKFDRGKVFFHCLKLGNMHAGTRIVIALYDVTGMTKIFKKMAFTMASDQQKRPSLRIGSEKHCVARSPGRVRCNNDHVMEGVTIYHTEQIR